MISDEMRAFMEEVARREGIPVADVQPATPRPLPMSGGYTAGLAVTFPCPKHNVEFDTLVGLCAWCSGSGRRRCVRIVPPGGQA